MNNVHAARINRDKSLPPSLSRGYLTAVMAFDYYLTLVGHKIRTHEAQSQIASAIFFTDFQTEKD